MGVKQFHLHLISDSTGETIASVARAVCAQFEGAQAIEHGYALVRGSKALARALKNIEENPGPVMFSILDRELRDTLQYKCDRLNVPCMSVLDPFVTTMGAFLKIKMSGRPGGQHIMDQDYFQRIAALNYTLQHDDGQNPDDLNDADIILVGASRTSKTPTCMYLAHRGIKAANVPLVPSGANETAHASDVLMPPPPQLLQADAPLIIGLTTSPSQLAHIRKNRILAAAGEDGGSYSDLGGIKAELAEAQRLFARHNWQVIDVTRRSIEEAASAILNLYYDRQAAHE